MGSIKEKQEGSEEEASESKSWSRPPVDIWESILKLLSLRDYLQFGRVCKSWRTIVANAIARGNCRPAPQVPLLILDRGPDDNIKSPCFFDLTKQKLIYPQTPLFKESEYSCGSFEGWLFLVDTAALMSSQDRNFHFFNSHSSPFSVLNPISGDRMLLPSLSNITSDTNPKVSMIVKFVASSSPNCQDCIVVGLLQSHCHLAVCINKCWTLIEAKPNMVFMDIEISGKTVYVLVREEGNNQCIIFYDLEDGNAPKPSVLISLGNTPKIRRGNISTVGTTVNITDSDLTFLVKEHVSGELFMVTMLVDYAFSIEGSAFIRHVLFLDKCIIPPRAKEFHVWKMKKSDSHVTQWLEVDDLDGGLIYLKSTGSIIITDTSQLNDPQEFVKKNCIYFLVSFKNEMRSFDIGIGRFCMTDKSTEIFRPSDLSAGNQAMLDRGIWFRPNIP